VGAVHVLGAGQQISSWLSQGPVHVLAYSSWCCT
jgi:hypothetical protein